MTTPEEKRKLSRLRNDLDEQVLPALERVEAVQKAHSAYHLEHKVRLRSIEKKLVQHDHRFDRIEAKLGQVEGKLGQVERKLDQIIEKLGA